MKQLFEPYGSKAVKIIFVLVNLFLVSECIELICMTLSTFHTSLRGKEVWRVTNFCGGWTLPTLRGERSVTCHKLWWGLNIDNWIAMDTKIELRSKLRVVRIRTSQHHTSLPNVAKYFWQSQLGPKARKKRNWIHDTGCEGTCSLFTHNMQELAKVNQTGCACAQIV